MSRIKLREDKDRGSPLERGLPAKLHTVEYRKGAEGFIWWVEDNVRLPIYPSETDIATWYPVKDLPRAPNPETGRSYWEFWCEQKEVARIVLRMEGTRFAYSLILLCWMRGEGKSMFACLIQLWKFFCWPRQQIMLGANSKDQIKFVHYDIMRDIIRNSPRLLANVGGIQNIREKEIRIRDSSGNIVSRIRAISSFSGIVSNITGYTFSEIFDMKNPKFFVQLDGSVRNIPNALGVIDSTVSAKDHVLYRMYQSFMKGETKKVYFHYRFSSKGNPMEYWNPNMTDVQLSDYKVKFPFGEFERYFLNTWSAGQEEVFTPEMIEAWEFLGVDGALGGHPKIIRLFKKRNEELDQLNSLEVRGIDDLRDSINRRNDDLEARLWPVEKEYSMRDIVGLPQMVTLDGLDHLSDLYDTDFSVLAGLDRADPMKTRTGARSMVAFLAKGLPGSRSNPFAYDLSKAVPNYYYFLLHLVNVETHSLEDIKETLKIAHDEYDGLDSVCGERWGIWDLAKWCEEEEVKFEPVYPSYAVQKGAFTEFFNAVKFGRFKSPPVAIDGSKESNILAEEARIFDHNVDKRWFGSPEKKEKYGIQDDTMFTVTWGIHGGKMFGPEDFRPRKRTPFFGIMVPNKDLVANW